MLSPPGNFIVSILASVEMIRTARMKHRNFQLSRMQSALRFAELPCYKATNESETNEREQADRANIVRANQFVLRRVCAGGAAGAAFDRAAWLWREQVARDARSKVDWFSQFRSRSIARSASTFARTERK